MSDINAISDRRDSGLLSWFMSPQTSFQSLLSSESKLLQYVKNKYIRYFVPIFNHTQFLRTFETFGPEIPREKTPIVLLHGVGAAIGFWCKNIDSISNHRRLYAIDLLGFGFSSRPEFPKDCAAAERLFVESVEEWRKSVGLKQFILLGHSFGGFIACAYSIRYPERVRHLILADPWGFCYSDPYNMTVLKCSFVMRLLFPILRKFNPLAIVRLFGPFGPALVRMYINDIGDFFQRKSDTPDDISVDCKDIYDYIYHCNARIPSGETAFQIISLDVGSAYHNMVDRIEDLDKGLPISFIFGDKSWLDSSVGRKFLEQRPESYVNISIFPECGHHVFIEDFVRFNREVNDICKAVDLGHDTIPNSQSNERYQLFTNATNTS